MTAFMFFLMCAAPVLMLAGWLVRAIERMADQRNLARRQWRRNRYRKDVLRKPSADALVSNWGRGRNAPEAR